MSRLGIGIGTTIGQQLAASMLDQLSVSASAAWSLRKLRGSYSGSAIRVRRSSDDTEQDIGFDAAGGLDTAGLLSFVGAGNGFVKTWYDQSGNSKNVTQTTAASQPQIVSSGSVISQGTRPALSFDGTNDYLEGSDTGLPTGAATFVAVSRYNQATLAPTDYKVVMCYGTESIGSGVHLLYCSDAVMGLKSLGVSQYGDSFGTEDQFQKHNLQFVTKPATTGTWKQWINDTTSASKSMTTNTTLGGSGKLRMGAFTLGSPASYYCPASIQEIIIWPADLESSRPGIQSLINSYYGVY